MISVSTSIVFYIVRRVDPSLRKALATVKPPYFMVSWLITWFAHDLSSEDAAGVFEYCLQREAAAIVPAYLSAAVLICKRDSILENEEDEMHQVLKSLPAKCDFREEVFRKADELLRQIPPATVVARFRGLKGTSMAVPFENLLRVRFRWAVVDGGEFLWRHRMLVLSFLILSAAILYHRYFCKLVYFCKE